MNRLLHALRLDSPAHTFVIGVGVGLGAAIGFIYSEELQSAPSEHENQAAHVRVQKESSQTEESLKKIGSGTAGALGGASLAFLSLTVLDMGRLRNPDPDEEQ